MPICDGHTQPTQINIWLTCITIWQYDVYRKKWFVLCSNEICGKCFFVFKWGLSTKERSRADLVDNVGCAHLVDNVDPSRPKCLVIGGTTGGFGEGFFWVFLWFCDGAATRKPYPDRVLRRDDFARRVFLEFSDSKKGFFYSFFLFF